MEPVEQRRCEFFLAGAGSPDVNGSYVQTSTEVDVVFYEKRPSDNWFLNGETGKSTGLVFIITLDSLPDMGEDFELAWVLKSTEAVIYYAAPFEEDEEMPPLKGWVAVEGLLPVPSHLIERPILPPRDRTSNLDIIVEDEERDFSLPYWEPDEQEIPGSIVETDTFDPFFGWDNDYGEDDSGGYSSEQDDSDEIELPTDLMDNFKDGMFNHKLKTDSDSVERNSVERRSSDQQRRSYGHQGGEGKFDTGDNIFLEEESSEFDECIVRHDTEEFEIRGEPFSRSSTSGQGDVEQNEEGIESPRSPSQGELDESETTSSSFSRGRQANNNQESKENQISLDIKSEELNEKPISPRNANDKARSPRNKNENPRSPRNASDRPHSPVRRDGSLRGCRVLRGTGANHKAPVISLPEDPFSTPSHSRYRRSRDYIDIDLVTAPPELLSVLSPRRKSQRRISGRNSFEDFPIQMPRRRSSERSYEYDIPNEAENKENKPLERKNSVEKGNLLDDFKQKREKSPVVDEKANRLKLQKLEIQKLQNEAHQLKTKMRKCDRISKVRKRGTTLSKIQQELLVNKSKYQHRYEEIKKLLGSDNIKS